MIPISKKDAMELNYLAKGEGAEAIEYLANFLYDYFTKQTVTTEGSVLFRSQGMAQLAQWLKTLPKGLRDVHDTIHP